MVDDGLPALVEDVYAVLVVPVVQDALDQVDVAGWGLGEEVAGGQVPAVVRAEFAESVFLEYVRLFEEDPVQPGVVAEHGEQQAAVTTADVHDHGFRWEVVGSRDERVSGSDSDAMPTWKIAAVSASRAKWSKNGIPNSRSTGEVPVRTVSSSSPAGCQNVLSVSIRIAVWKDEGTSVRSNSAVGVSANRPVSSSVKIPRVASSRRVRYRLSESAPTASARSATGRGHCVRWSATPNTATARKAAENR